MKLALGYSALGHRKSLKTMHFFVITLLAAHVVPLAKVLKQDAVVAPVAAASKAISIFCKQSGKAAGASNIDGNTGKQVKNGSFCSSTIQGTLTLKIPTNWHFS